jgi:hypothetical protein
VDRAILGKTHGGYNAVFMHIQAGTTHMKNFHAFLLSCAAGAGHPGRKL